MIARLQKRERFGDGPARAGYLLFLSRSRRAAAHRPGGQLGDDRLQRSQQGARVLESRLRILRHRAVDHRLERRRGDQAGPDCLQRWNRLREVCSEIALLRLGDEWTSSGQKLEQQDARGIHIGPRIHGRALRLFRRDIGGRSKRDADTRQRITRARPFEELHHSEVEESHVIFVVRQRLQEHVGGFQIAMDDSSVVSEGKTAQRLGDDVERLPERQWPFCNEIRERSALQELHHQIRNAAVDARVRHRNDVGVGKRRQRPGLTIEPLAPFRDGGRLLMQHLDRYEPVELRLPAPVDDPDDRPRRGAPAPRNARQGSVQ